MTGSVRAPLQIREVGQDLRYAAAMCRRGGVHLTNWPGPPPTNPGVMGLLVRGRSDPHSDLHDYLQRQVMGSWVDSLAGLAVNLTFLDFVKRLAIDTLGCRGTRFKALDADFNAA
ncbi:MAG: hypothetical protein ACI9TP_001563 [Candidatus Azotimanducaceae bacterium]